MPRVRLLALVPWLIALGCKKPPAEESPAGAASASAAASASPSSEGAKYPPDNPASSGANAFACELWKKLPRAGNLAVSPASISLALAMTYSGARGETAKEMQRTLHFPGGPDAAPAEWGKIASALATPSQVKLKVASRLFGEKTWPFEKPFLESTKATFAAPLELVDFKGQPDVSRKQINHWVEEETEKRIKDLIPEGGVTPATKLALVNAIHFTGSWSSPFESRLTKPLPFFRSKAEKKDVPTMVQSGRFRLGTTPTEQVLVLPYKGETAAMLVVVPTATDGLAELESRLSPATLLKWDAAVAMVNVRVELPKFTVEAAQPLKLGQELDALGMPQAFDREKANFDGIAPSPDPKDRMRIDQVFHKAFVKVDEEGTEAAAATAVMAAAGGGAPAKPVEFKADRPFLFLILDRKTKLALFVGRVTEP